MAKRKPRRGAAGSEAHYEDGRYYDQAYRRRRHDVRFYTRPGGRVGRPCARARRRNRPRGARHRQGWRRRRRHRADGADARAGPRATGRVSLVRREIESSSAKATSRVCAFAGSSLWSSRPSTYGCTSTRARRSNVASRPCAITSNPEAASPSTCCCPTPSASPAIRRSGTAVAKSRTHADGVRYRYSEYFSYDPVTQIETVVMDFEHPERRRAIVLHTAHPAAVFPRRARGAAALQRLRRGVPHGRLRRQADHRGAPSLRSSSPKCGRPTP